MRAIGHLLCLLGWHDWAKPHHVADLAITVCKRCGWFKAQDCGTGQKYSCSRQQLIEANERSKKLYQKHTAYRSN
jgi:hypothetical protein